MSTLKRVLYQDTVGTIKRHRTDIKYLEDIKYIGGMIRVRPRATTNHTIMIILCADLRVGVCSNSMLFTRIRGLKEKVR
eukprot:SAG11_NODE_822_length_7009_cov_7.776122_1_plen_79_part_00